jgi:hypothetical protein
MLNWLKKILGIGPSVPAAVEAAIPAPEEKPKPKTKKKTTAKSKTSDTAHLEAMTKKELLEVAKVHGIKANASLSKAELVKRVKNG